MRQINCCGLIILLLFFVSTGCKKEYNSNNSDTSFVIQNNSAEIVSNDIFKLVLYSIMTAEDGILHPNDTSNFHFDEPCMQIGVGPADSITWPKTITLSFPNSNCSSFDGYVRSGEIIITAMRLSDTVGAKFIVTLNNYSVNGILVSGIKKMSVAELSSGEAIAFNDTSEFQFNTSSGIINWHAQHNLKWVLGKNTKTNIADDLFLSMGTCSSDLFTGIITSALQFRNYCFWIGSGQVEISPVGLSKRQVIYLDSCLNQADVIISNETYRVNF